MSIFGSNAWNDAGHTRILKTADTMTGPLATSSNKVCDEADLTELQDAAAKSYVNALQLRSNKAKPVITIWAEGSGCINKFNFKLYFGDRLEGLHHSGYPMTSAGRVLRMGLVAVKNNGAYAQKTMVYLVVNGEAQCEYKVTKPEDVNAGATIFADPLEVGINDVINFMPVRTDVRAVTTVVSCLIELDR